MLARSLARFGATQPTQTALQRGLKFCGSRDSISALSGGKIQSNLRADCPKLGIQLRAELVAGRNIAVTRRLLPPFGVGKPFFQSVCLALVWVSFGKLRFKETWHRCPAFLAWQLASKQATRRHLHVGEQPTCSPVTLDKDNNGKRAELQSSRCQASLARACFLGPRRSKVDPLVVCLCPFLQERPPLSRSCALAGSLFINIGQAI